MNTGEQGSNRPSSKIQATLFYGKERILHIFQPATTFKNSWDYILHPPE